MDRQKTTGYGMVAVAAVGWGTWPLILRHAPMPASLQSAILLTVLTVASAPVVYVFGDRVSARREPRHWAAVAALGVSDALNVILFFAAYQRTTVAIAVLTHYLTPVFVAVGAPLFLGEVMRRRTMVAAGISFVGLVLLLEPWRADLTTGDLVGAALGAGSAVFYAANVLINKRLAPVFSASELMLFHGFFSVPILWLLVPSSAIHETAASAFVVVVLGSIGPGALGGLVFVWGLRRIAASHASILTLFEPFVAVLIGVVLLGQRFAFSAVVGGVFILIGAVMVVFSTSSPHHGRQME